MRELAWFVIAIIVTNGSSRAAEYNPPGTRALIPWLNKARDYIVRRPTLQPAATCGSSVACSLVTANTSARCEAVIGGTLFAARPTLQLYGVLYYYAGRLSRAKVPVDRSVVDGATAIVHEYDWHIIPAAMGVIPLLEELDAARFTSQAACERAAAKTSAAVVTKFRELLAETQRHEVTAGTRPPVPVAQTARAD